MNTEENKPTIQTSKKFPVSIPFIVIGLLLLGMILPVMGDVDGDGKSDSCGKYVMYKFFTSQENAKAGGEAVKGELTSEGGPGGLRGASAGLGGGGKSDSADDADEKKEE